MTPAMYVHLFPTASIIFAERKVNLERMKKYSFPM